MVRPAIIVHGGAGMWPSPLLPGATAGCLAAARIGWAFVADGGSALDAAVAAVIALEDDPRFNAGRGSMLTENGTVEMDASAMDGAALAAGACAAVQGIRNPIALARAILADGNTVLLVGAGAERFADQHGIARCPPEALITDAQRARWQQRRTGDPGGNTVGAVAIDRAGHVAAATSTGGLFNKRAGRVGDSALIGAGTYADDTAGAASATGIGEAIMRVALAKTAVDLLRDGRHPMHATRAAVHDLARRTAAAGGIILVDALGRIGYAQTQAHMPIAFRDGTHADFTAAC
jgi:beta-aspartyl-peptidase (threonine type)